MDIVYILLVILLLSMILIQTRIRFIHYDMIESQKNTIKIQDQLIKTQKQLIDDFIKNFRQSIISNQEKSPYTYDK
jgi:hypothetical protein